MTIDSMNINKLMKIQFRLEVINKELGYNRRVDYKERRPQVDDRLLATYAETGPRNKSGNTKHKTKQFGNSELLADFSMEQLTKAQRLKAPEHAFLPNQLQKLHEHCIHPFRPSLDVSFLS